MFRQTPRQIPECATLTIEREGLIRPMARKLKTYQTSLGFFDLAIAAPSMKAALEAWGADSNLFHQGAAKESPDPDIIATTMAKPGVVLRRPVGSDRLYSEHAELPTNLGGGGSTKGARKSKGPKAKQPSSRPVDEPLRSERPLSPTNGNRSAAMLNGRGRRPRGRRSVNAVSRRSTRHRLQWDQYRTGGTVVCSYRRQEFGRLMSPPQAMPPVRIDNQAVPGTSQLGWSPETRPPRAPLLFRNRA
jgi:hypothetical protein